MSRIIYHGPGPEKDERRYTIEVVTRLPNSHRDILRLARTAAEDLAAEVTSFQVVGDERTELSHFNYTLSYDHRKREARS